MSDNELHFLAVTDDPVITQVLHEMGASDSWNVVMFRDPAHVLSATVDHAHAILLDEALAGVNYLSIVKRVRRRFPESDVTVVGGPKSDEVRVGPWTPISFVRR
ncbi:MAG: hypothetical protein P8181_14960 [bacterium]